LKKLLKLIPVFNYYYNGEWNKLLNYSIKYSKIILFFNIKSLNIKLLRLTILLRRYDAINLFSKKIISNKENETILIALSVILTSLKNNYNVNIYREKLLKEKNELLDLLNSYLSDKDSDLLLIEYLSAFDKVKNNKEVIERIIKEFRFLDCCNHDLKKIEILFQYMHYFKNEKFLINDKVILYVDPWVSSFGHFYFLDSFIKGIILDLIPITKVYFIENGTVSNKHLYNEYQKILLNHNILADGLPKYIFANFSVLNLSYWPDKQKNLIHSYEFSNKIQKKWIKENNNSLLNSIMKNNYLIKKINPLNKEIICIHVREAGFRSDFNSHENLRNADPIVLFSSLEKFKNKYLFIRHGNKSMTPVPKIYSDFIFDYAHSTYKSEENDLFFLKNSKAFIGCCSGISMLPITLNIPTLYINWFPLTTTINWPSSMMLVKLPYDKYDNPLKIKDMLKVLPTFHYSGSDTLQNIGIYIKDNKREDILYSLIDFLNYVESNKSIINFSQEIQNNEDKSNYIFGDILRLPNEFYLKNIQHFN
jgi:putative glycosyltransferase (TIGR04372 family)